MFQVALRHVEEALTLRMRIKTNKYIYIYIYISPTSCRLSLCNPNRRCSVTLQDMVGSVS